MRLALLAESRTETGRSAPCQSQGFRVDVDVSGSEILNFNT